MVGCSFTRKHQCSGRNSRDSSSTPRLALFLFVQAIFLTVYIIWTSAPEVTPRLTSKAAQFLVGDTAAPRAPAGGAPPCNLDYVRVIQEAVKAKSPPQLSLEQLLWIKTIVQTSAFAVTSQSRGSHNFLVWGLGFDSMIWDNANCIPFGTKPSVNASGTAGRLIRTDNVTKTIFIENWLDWVAKVKGKYPTLDVVHFDKYATSVETAGQFFDNPYMLPLPGKVNEVCWHVVLVGKSSISISWILCFTRLF